MIHSSDSRTVLIHFDGTAGQARWNSERRPQSDLSEAQAERTRWYLEWTAEGDRNVFVLLPECLNADENGQFGVEPVPSHPQPADLRSQISNLRGGEGLGDRLSLQPDHVVRYSDEGDFSLSLPRRRGYAFIINGNQFPIIHWRQALAAARRNNADVLAFGQSEASSGTRYPESVLVDGSGRVVRFKRHYHDSPAFADRWSGEASFLVVKGEHARAVAAHVIVRGWGLDQMGSLVRRFNLQWSDDPSVHSDPGAPGTDTNELFDGAFDPGSSVATTANTELTYATDDLPDVRIDGIYLFAKRALDIVVSGVGLIVLMPFLVVVGVLVKLTSPGPALFAHIRQGLGGKEFPCLKFRSMRTGADAMQVQLKALNEVDGPQFKISDDPRLTGFGSWIRRWNIDELPQLFNVLAGQMSLVGPRPSPDSENQFCPAWRRARLSTKPGITGLWQVLRLRDENSSDFQEWIYYDVEYARHRSFWLDLRILFYTLPAIMGSRRVKGFARRLESAGICTHSPLIDGGHASRAEVQENQPRPISGESS